MLWTLVNSTVKISCADAYEPEGAFLWPRSTNGSELESLGCVSLHPIFFTFTDLTVKWRLDRSMNEKRSSLVQHFSFGLCSLQKLLDRREKQQEIEWNSSTCLCQFPLSLFLTLPSEKIVCLDAIDLEKKKTHTHDTFSPSASTSSSCYFP